LSGRGSLPPAPIRACGWLESCGSCYLQDRQTGPRQRHDLHQLPEPAWRRNPAPGLDNAVAWRRFPTWLSNNADESRPCRGPADHQGHHRDDRAEYAQSFPHGALLAGHSRDGPCGSPTPDEVPCRHPNWVNRRAGVWQVSFPPEMPGRAVCPALGPGGRWTPWHAENPRGKRWSQRSRPCMRSPAVGRLGCRVGWSTRLRLGAGMPAPSGPIPPPWARWENEAPTARAACRTA
jgi:hypothetical protein